MNMIQTVATATPFQETEHSFSSWDGSTIFYRAWRPPYSVDKAVILFHRGHEHSERYRELVEALQITGVAIFAWDARGHGKSAGDRGHAPGFTGLVKDADAFIRHISRGHNIPISNMVVLGNSVGSTIAATWVHDYAPPIRAMVLGTPAFRVRLYMPFALAFLKLWRSIDPKATIKSYVKPRMLTHDPEQVRAYAADPLITREISVDVLIGLHEAAARIVDNAAAIKTPTLLLTAGSDFVVRKSVQRRFFERLSSPAKEMHLYSGFFHDIFHEKERRKPITQALRFVQEAFTNNPFSSRMEKAAPKAQSSFRPKMPWFRAASYRVARFLMRSVGRLSEGVRLGLRSGFDSGPMLDYVYKNEARGRTALGRAMDRHFLDAIGWRGIRNRKRELEKTIGKLLKEIGSERDTVHLVDIAAGGGRYLFDALAQHGTPKVSAWLCDLDSESLDTARYYAQGRPDVHVLERDALSDQPIATSVKFDIAIVSGLYELISSNQLVSRSLKGIARMVRPGGYLIYTNQPWHPQLEFIARVLNNRHGAPWIMRPRPQGEIDSLVHAAGFDRVDFEIEPNGVFTVAVAQRRPRRKPASMDSELALPPIE